MPHICFCAWLQRLEEEVAHLQAANSELLTDKQEALPLLQAYRLAILPSCFAACYHLTCAASYAKHLTVRFFTAHMVCKPFKNVCCLCLPAQPFATAAYGKIAWAQTKPEMQQTCTANIVLSPCKCNQHLHEGASAPTVQQRELSSQAVIPSNSDELCECVCACAD